MEWKDLYPKDNKIKISHIEQYLSDEANTFFREFIDTLSTKYKLTYVKPKFLKKYGWVLEVGRSGLMLDMLITFSNKEFYVDDVVIDNKEALNTLLKSVENQYNNSFSNRYDFFIAERVKKQMERDRLRKQREKDYLESIQNEINDSKFNIFKWSPKIPREKIKRLYKSDASGIIDEELLDEVGYTLYNRCLQGKEERQLIDKGKMKCHHCKAILNGSRDLIACECGYQYMYKDYMKSFRTNNMPANGAATVFNKFIERWVLMRNYAEKMRLIDWLIHEFHVNLISGAKGRFVGVNLIQGTKKQIKELILDLAYGE